MFGRGVTKPFQRLGHSGLQDTDLERGMQGSSATGIGDAIWQPVLNGRHPNFRMMGGMTVTGRKLRQGAFLRGPALHDLSADEWRELIIERDLSLIVDFRHADEVVARPNSLPTDLINRAITLPIKTGASSRLASEINDATVSHERAASAMRAAYTDFANQHLQIYADFLAHVARASGRAVFFHCTAGKDRTGFAAALILLALGVPREQVMADFLASGTYWRPDATLKAHVPEAAHPAIFGIDASYLDAAITELERTQGSAAAFARNAMGGDRAFHAWLDHSLI